ncbi:MAG TPA: hypothetical protein PK813_04265 [Candidatus Hydrogenedens sp.]|nr:hypothetical protein [Candidatus Hydrogenedens sp.]
MQKKNTGAALVLAIGIIAILLAIGFTFYFVTRGELYVADLSLRQAQSDELLRGAMNIAMSYLNNDLNQHPFASSTDHSWRSFFNGSWVAGKPWAIRNVGLGPAGLVLRSSLQSKQGIPYIDVSRPWVHFPNLQGYMLNLPLNRRFLYVRFADGYYELLYNGPRSRNWLFYPRIENLNAPVIYDLNAELVVPDADPSKWVVLPQKEGNNYLYYRVNINAKSFNEITRDGDIPSNVAPFLLPAMYGRVQYPDGSPVFTGADRNGVSYANGQLYTREWVNAWADVDLDGDGYKDAIWMPMSADRLFSGLITDSAGDIREIRDDGLDNNLNGLVDEKPDNDINEEGPVFGADDLYDPTDQFCEQVGDKKVCTPDPEEVFEIGAFVYWGGNDGLDNDCNGLIDDDDKDDNGNPREQLFLTAPLPGLRIKVDWNADGVINQYDMVPDENGNLVYLQIIMPSSIEIVNPISGKVRTLTAENVDCLDNDYDMLVNNFETYAYIGPNNLERFFKITDTSRIGSEVLELAGPPFVLKGFVTSGPNRGAPIYDIYKNNQADVEVYDYMYAKFAMPGNWNLEDTYRFRSAKSASFIEINHFLDANGNVFLPGIQIYPTRGKYKDIAGGVTRDINYESLIPFIHITHTGEPICDLYGRMAVYIEDESSKINLNATGGHYPIDFNFTVPETSLADKLRRTYFVPGMSSPWLLGYGMETRFLPTSGRNIARKFWNLLTGASHGQIDSSVSDYSLGVGSSPLYYDMAFPGYGVADDNANAFLLLTNGLDDDGDGIVDNGVNNWLGILEGIDEPGEFQKARPYLNKIAERDFADDNQNGVTDELGELGDRIISTTDQISELLEYGEPGSKNISQIMSVLTSFGLSKNVQTKKFGASLRGINPVNINYASANQIASTLMMFVKPASTLNTISWKLPTAYDAFYFAEGLRSYEDDWSTWFQEDNNEPGFFFYNYDNVSGIPVSAMNPNSETQCFNFPVDPLLKTIQFAVNLVDMRDSDVVQTRLTTEKVPSSLSSSEEKVYNPSTNKNTLSVFEKGHNPENFPLKEIENYMKETLEERNIFFAINDYWWANRVDNGISTDGTILKDLRSISYTVAGVESIRITELMVRPVRRLELEVPVYQNYYNYYRTNYSPGIPLFLADVEALSNRFVDDDEHDIVPAVPWVLSANVLGKENYYETTEETFRYIDNTTSPSQEFDFPNVIEFRIRATKQLPPGRYYLVLNTNNLTDHTLKRGSTQHLKYAVKYCAVNVNAPDVLDDDTLIEPSVLDDVRNEPNLVNDDAVFQRVQDAWIGVNARGEETGKVFLPGQLESQTLPPPNYWLDGILPEERPVNGKTFTVTVPPYTPDDGDNTNDFVLCIAFWAENVNSGSPIALNYLEFSQEPDHEYIELTNISNKHIDLTGYTLEIGIPRDKNGFRIDPYKVVAKIGDPNNPNDRYTIAPKGRLLLTFDSSTDLPNDKYDHYKDVNYNPDSIIKKNGIGVCNIIPDVAPPAELEFLTYITTPFVGLEEVENVFNRRYTNASLEEDLVDYNSDGVLNDNVFDNEIESTPSNLNINVAGPRKAWDRIVPLSSVEFPLIDVDISGTDKVDRTERRKIDQIVSVNDIAKLILQGGILPNEPENDGYDNDGDGRVLLTGGKTQLGILEKDGVDNNLNGFVDDRPTDESNPLNILYNEGVDEGRIGPYSNNRVYGYGSYESGMLPVFHLKSMTYFTGNIEVDFISDPYDGNNPPNKTTGLNYSGNPDLIAPYLGTDDDPPQWKAFVEKRWNPGDCVVVCLYDQKGGLVDGVSYNELDVTNRAIDDILPAPNELQLNPDFASWWIPDCMLWDFYRSLNRKHPEYAGDKHGLSNRWEATDGYYDDWEESPHYLEQIVNVMINNEEPNNFPLFGYTNENPYRLKTDIDFVVRTYNSTPLAKSYTEIALESKDFSTPEGSLPDAPVINGRTLTLSYPFWNLEQNRDLGVAYTGVIDRIKIPIQNQFLTSAYRQKSLFINPENRYLFDLSRQNLVLYRPGSDEFFWRQVWTGGEVTASQLKNKVELGQTLKDAPLMFSTEGKVLTVGTAEFIPIRPNPNETDVFPSGGNFQTMITYDLNNNIYPEAWVPLFLFMFPGESYTYPKFVDGSTWAGQYPTPLPTLFNAEPGDSWLVDGSRVFGRPQVDINDVAQRWQIPKRVFAYASSYRTIYPERNRPEALFIWDVEDGVENGDYCVYINVVSEEQMRRLQYYDEKLHAGGTPTYELFSEDFGKLWINQDYDPTQVRLAIEVITDPAQAKGLKPRGSTIPTGLTHPDDWYRTDNTIIPEDVVVYQPDRNGIIIYGKQAAAGWRPQMIKVTQKFIALRVRNVGDAPCFLTNIVLSPSKSTSYKINVNTIEPYIYTRGRSKRVFISSMCLPGMFYRQSPLPKDADLSNPTYGINPIPVTDATYTDNLSDTALSAFQLSYLLTTNRPEHEDGRYYSSPMELADINSGKYLTPLSVKGNYIERINDVLSRYEAVADHISFRSDVFQIIALVQLGQAVDINKDGCFNYRTNDEFVVRAESKGRMIYERSVPAARYEED